MAGTGMPTRCSRTPQQPHSLLGRFGTMRNSSTVRSCRSTSWTATKAVSLYGRVLVGERRLRIETNSAARADILRSRLEGICGALVTHRLREHQDPTSTAQREGPKTAPRPPSIPPEVREALRAHKQRLLEDWLDQPIPALKDRTPRQAVRTKAGRSQVDLLLRDMELMQARFSDGIETDFARLRTLLGL